MNKMQYIVSRGRISNPSPTESGECTDMNKMQHIDPGWNWDEDFPLSQGKGEGHRRR